MQFHAFHCLCLFLIVPFSYPGQQVSAPSSPWRWCASRWSGWLTARRPSGWRTTTRGRLPAPSPAASCCSYAAWACCCSPCPRCHATPGRPAWTPSRSRWSDRGNQTPRNAMQRNATESRLQYQRRQRIHTAADGTGPFFLRKKKEKKKAWKRKTEQTSTGRKRASRRVSGPWLCVCVCLGSSCNSQRYIQYCTAQCPIALYGQLR